MSSRTVSFLAGLLSGALVGVAAVFLLAPYSGVETRQRIANQAREIIEAGKQAATQRRQELKAEYQARIQIPLTPPER